jgi:hypothetical protein
MTAEPSRPNTPITYRDSGVDIDAGNALVEAIKPLVKATRRPGADADLGGFGGLFDLKRAGFIDPILVAANDGVGTKLLIAIESGVHGSIGVDLVAMCRAIVLPRLLRNRQARLDRRHGCYRRNRCRLQRSWMRAHRRRDR